MIWKWNLFTYKYCVGLSSKIVHDVHVNSNKRNENNEIYLSCFSCPLLAGAVIWSFHHFDTAHVGCCYCFALTAFSTCRFHCRQCRWMMSAPKLGNKFCSHGGLFMHVNFCRLCVKIFWILFACRESRFLPNTFCIGCRQISLI